ncbi:MAG: hypothetical protein FJ271_24755 [Planctomycetes bacterium]|nr:hypothetical protein [Planctomycetota bacterium]
MCRRNVLVLFALLPIACARLEGNSDQDVPGPYELTADDMRLARELAERDLGMPRQPASPSDRIVFVKVDMLPDARAGAGQRQVMVHHYRYRGDRTVLTHVDLNRLEVLGVETLSHFPTGLAAEEVERAERLARADDRLRTVFAGDRLRVEARPIDFAANQPLHGRRVVHLLLRDGSSYLSSPRVLVDLSTDAVLVNEVID